MKEFFWGLAIVVTLGTSSSAEGGALTARDVVIQTFQNHPEIQALRYSFQSERYLSASLRANFNELRKGFRVKSEYGKRGDASKITPNGEVFVEKNLGGYSFSGNVGSDFSVSKFEDESRGYAELRAEIPIVGSDKRRDQEVKLLKQEGDKTIAQIEFFKKVQEQIKDATDSYNEAVNNKNLFELQKWYLGELRKLQKIARSRKDSSALKKIDKLIYDAEAQGRALKQNFDADLDLLRSRMGIDERVPLRIDPASFNASLDSLENIISDTLRDDPQIRALEIAIAALVKQQEIIDGARLDILGVVKGGFEFPGFGKNHGENGYVASGTLVWLFPDGRVRESQLGAVNSKLQEIRARLKGARSTALLVIKEKYRRAEVLKQKRDDIGWGMGKAQGVYLDKIARYQAGQINFDAVDLALEAFYQSKYDYASNSLGYANRVTELLLSAGTCFKTLEEARISLNID